MRRYFCGEEAAAKEEEAAAEAGADNGAHRLRFGDAGLSSGSKSRVLFKVAPQAIAPGGGRAEEGGSEQGAGETTTAAAVVVVAAGPAQRRLPRCLGRAGGEGREGGRERRGQLRQGLRRLPVGLSLGSGPGPPSGSGSAGWIPALAARPALAGPIPPAAGGGARAGPRGAGPGPATRCGAADDERWRQGPGGGSGGASLCDSHTSNMASITTPRIQKPTLRTAPAFLGRWRPRRLRGIVVSPPWPRGWAAGRPQSTPGLRIPPSPAPAAPASGFWFKSPLGGCGVG